MPSTQELVSIIKNDYAPDWSRSKILELLNRAQKRLFNQDTEQSTWYNPNDDEFPFPILKTTAETLEYEITGSNLVDMNGNALSITQNGYAVTCRRIKHIFIMVASLSNSNYDRKFYGEQFNLTGINEYWSQRLYRLSFYKVPGNLFDKTNLQNARFLFHEDPGTYADRYFVEFYYNPIELTSESIPLSLDGDKWEMALIDGTVGYIEDIENGKSDRMNKFETYWMRKFLSSQNENSDERRPFQMLVREAG